MDDIAANLAALGFETEIGGGGAEFLSVYFDAGSVWITWETPDAIGPTESDFVVCAYDDSDDMEALCDFRPTDPKPLTLAQAAAAAIAVAKLATPTPCAGNRHTDTGRGVCADCGAFL